jgi:hypothetical protein
MHKLNEEQLDTLVLLDPLEPKVNQDLMDHRVSLDLWETPEQQDQ